MGTVMLFGLAVPVIELILGVLMLCVILGMFSFAMWMVFRGQQTIDKVMYPVVVPGWKMRMAEPPPFNCTPEEVGRMCQLLLKHAVAKGYPKAKVKQTLNTSLVRWVKADPSLGGKRAVVDPYGRRVPVTDSKGNQVYEANKQPKTAPMLVAGWHTGKTLFVVFVPEDVIEKTAFAHEGGHGLHLIKGISDYDHADQEMWGGKDEAGNRVDGIVTLAKAEMHKERTGEDPVEPLDNGIEVKAG